MKTAQEREKAFRAELAELLKKHGAELNVTDDAKPYGMHMGICEVIMPSQWDEEGEILAEYTEFRL